MIEKSQMIDRIISMNPTVQEEFLVNFSYDELSGYLGRLETLNHTAREEAAELAPAVIDAT